MSKSDLIKKVEDAINSFKHEVEKNDGSTLTTIGKTISMGFDSLVESVSSNKNAQKATETVKKHLGDLEKAIIKGDKKISSGAISAMQKAFNGLKSKISDDSSDETGKGSGVKYTPNKSTVFTAGKHQDVPVAKPNKESDVKADDAKPEPETKAEPEPETKAEPETKPEKPTSKTGATPKKTATQKEESATKKASSSKPKTTVAASKTATVKKGKAEE